MTFGISEKSFSLIINTLSKYTEIQTVKIFGSRAMGNYKRGSDIDIAIYGCQVTPELVNELSVTLNEELPIPYYFDIVHYESLNNKELKEHIDTYGKILYVKE